MSREAHVPFCERLEVKSLRPTHRTEAGAKQLGVLQSLLTTCRLHGIDGYTYFVDVLQRIQSHPAKRVQELTPRLWAMLFADSPLRSEAITLTT